jgi:hypothetical protein
VALSEVAICNDALNHIQVKAKIQSLLATEDDSPQAVLCADYYPRARDELLARRRWSFAERRVALTEVAGYTPPDGWPYAYSYPTDMLEPREFWVGSTRLAEGTFRAEALVRDPAQPVVLLSDVQELVLVYTAKITNPALFTTLFAEALAWRLAERLAEPLAETISVATRATKYAEMKESQAWAADLNGRRHRPLTLPSYVTGR